MNKIIMKMIKYNNNNNININNINNNNNNNKTIRYDIVMNKMNQMNNN